MGLMEVTLDISSLRTHGDTLYMSGTKIAKILFIGIDEAATSTKLGLINTDPYTQKLMLYPAGAAIGTRLGAPDGASSTAAMIPLFLSINVGLRLYTTPEDDEMVNVTYIEVTS